MHAGSAAIHPFHLLLEGMPKVGKTTVVERLVKLLVCAGMPVGGFVTREVLGDDGRRVGFKVRDLAGPEAWLAHQDLDTGIWVGRFGVDVAAFEQVGLAALEKATQLAQEQDGVTIIDEIACMELASPGFVQAIEANVRSPGDCGSYRSCTWASDNRCTEGPERDTVATTGDSV